MKYQFIYWLCLAFIFHISVASEKPFLHLSNQSAEQNTPRPYVRVTQQDHSIVRQQLMYSQVNPYDYVYVQTSDGNKRLKRKVDVESYQPRFELGMLNEYVAPSKGRRLFGHDYKQRLQYFANKFTGKFAENVFHCVLNYQYPGFCKYVQQLPGFDGFMLSITDQLKPGTELQKRMLAYLGGKEAFTALQRINKAKIKERDDREYQIKYQAVRQLLQERDFDQLGIGVLEQHKITDQFTYHGNMVQMAQLKYIAHFFNDVGAFGQTIDQLSDLQQIVDHVTGFGHLSNQANRSNNISLSQACLEIGRNILALGKGLQKGFDRNVTGIYHLMRYPVDTAEGLGYIAKLIGTGIGRLFIAYSKHDLGLELDDENLIRSAHQDVDGWVCGGRELYEIAKQTWRDKSKLERYELTGNVASDFLFAKGLSWIGKAGSVKNLANYKPQAFSKLGDIGWEINQIAGLICAKVPKYLRKSEQMVAAGEAGLAEINLIEELSALNLLKHEAQIANSTTKVNELTKIVEFEKSLLALQVEYGAGILHDAKQALRINNYKITNCHEAEVLNKLKQACVDIKYIQSQSHRYNFIYDVAQGGVTDGSITEALVACAAEDQGIVKKLMRSAETAYDFLDELGNKWDIKTFKSKYMISDKSYKEFINKSKIDISKGEYILFNITEASEDSVNKLKNFINLTLSEQEKNKITFIRY